MSIQEFHSQLTQDDQPDALMATLHRLARADESSVVEYIDTLAGWPQWGGSAA